MSALLCILLCAIAAPPDSAPARVDLEHGFYLISRPADPPDGTPLPLIICLHGTETTASGILEFWHSFDHTLPMILVAPQATHAGWRDSDVKLVEEFLAHVSKTVTYDPQRVLLTGHSAGGAMAFHLLYVQKFPASAVAVTANYVPPTVLAEHVRPQQQVPVFYAVGEADINRDRMRDGLVLLRANGVQVTVQRPQIGHVLDRGVGQAAMAWFESRCREQTRQVLDDAHNALQDSSPPGSSVAALEAVVRHENAQFPDQVEAAIDLLARLQQPGRAALIRADRLLQQGKAPQAREEILQVEARYQGSSLGDEARRRREDIEATPEMQELLRVQRSLGTAGLGPSSGGNGKAAQ